MKHIFIVNPTAGKGKFLQLAEEIKSIVEENKLSAMLHKTTAVGDGEFFVRKICEEHHSSETLRFYACGGDGTLNEVINGAVGYENAEVACVPIGTGNDFVRNFPDSGNFMDIKKQIAGKASPCDLIKYTGMVNGQPTERYCANMFNIGFDCNVVDLTGRLKQYPLISGSFAYLLGVGCILISKEGADLKVEFEDGSVFDGKLLLIAVANGCYCGGGVKGIPYASLDDGYMDVSLIKNTSRTTFLSLFPKYAKGTHLETEKAGKIVIYKKCKRLTITPNRDTMKFCIDGEITNAEKISFELVPHAFRFSTPQ